MQINTSKSGYTIFTPNNQVLKEDLDLRRWKSLEKSDLSKFLGLSLDPRFKSRSHKEKVAKSVRHLPQSYRNHWKNWGAKSQGLTTIYVTFIKLVKNETTLNKLDGLRRQHCHCQCERYCEVTPFRS
ncbi:hypothetical protein PoB_006301200 [Plakobranchus ocellatus]|uniref:Uncharacterized protein n=1 Tax=Plakobranchus ocellatus TaxID=259542 RepID=A0AAV4CX69_9GAST|nr:hypothetical protein PoB_006301200 [Plakobranchus ocellatus]